MNIEEINVLIGMQIAHGSFSHSISDTLSWEKMGTVVYYKKIVLYTARNSVKINRSKLHQKIIILIN